MTAILTLTAMLGTGLIAGTFLAFSSFVMAALAQQPHPAGLLAMQAINVTVINPVFMAVLFGTGVIALWLGWTGWNSGNRWLVAGAALYVLGALGTTMAFNVPLNNQLAAASAQDAASLAVWQNYLTAWTSWNTLRMLAAAAACGCFGWGMR